MIVAAETQITGGKKDRHVQEEKRGGGSFVCHELKRRKCAVARDARGRTKKDDAGKAWGEDRSFWERNDPE